MIKIGLVAGIILICYAGYNFISYISYYGNLTDYRKGYVVGNSILLIAGILFIYKNFKRK
jgi:hypothetical protein